MTLNWEKIKNSGSLSSTQDTNRAKVAGGWLVSHFGGVAFLPDPNHQWDGNSLP